VGKEYWDPFFKWVTEEAIVHGLITEEGLKLFTITDDLEQAFCLVRDECKMRM